MPFVFQIDAYDPVTAGAVTLRMASEDDPAVCHLDGQIWWPVLDRLPLLGMDFFGGEFGAVSTPGSSFSCVIEPFPHFTRLSYADARIRIWHGEAGAAWGGYILRFDGRLTAAPQIENGRAEFGFAVDDKWLDQPLLATYAGTGGAEGRAERKGAVKPLALGSPMGVPGVLLDEVKAIYQLSAYGAVESIDVPLERLARQFGSAVANYADYAALEAASHPAGTWATALSGGYVRHFAPPYGKICWLMKGDKGGPDGWVRRPGAMIKRIAAIAGGAAKVSEASVDALDAARPFDLSLYLGSQTTAREVIQSLAASVNAVAGVDLLGRLITIPIQINAAGLTLNVEGEALPAVADFRILANSAPWWKLAIGARPFWNVHSDGEYEALPPATVQYPAPVPVNPPSNQEYIDEEGMRYRNGGDIVVIDGEPILLDGEPIFASPWVDLQDRDIVAARYQVDITPPKAQTIFCDQFGNQLTNQFPRTLKVKVRMGIDDITGRADVTYRIEPDANSNIAASVENTWGLPTKGDILCTAGEPGFFSLFVIVDTREFGPFKVQFDRKVAPTTTPGGVGAKYGEDGTFELVPSTAFVRIAGPITVTVASGEDVQLTAVLDYQLHASVNSNAALLCKWRRSPAGAGTLTDVNAAISGSASYWRTDFENETGNGNFSASDPAPTPADYDYELWGAMSNDPASGSIEIFSSTSGGIAKVQVQ